MHFLVCFLLLVVMLLGVEGAPSTSGEGRKGKNLAYFDYMQPDEEYNYGLGDNDYVSMALDENDIGRTLPSSRKRLRPAGVSQNPNGYNSPIYYIRLPPQPYMFVPGLGYISQPPPPNAMSQFVNVPLSFVANGKPSTIYQWAGGFNDLPTEPPPILPPRPQKFPQRPSIADDSTVHRLPGQFNFNGKPDDIFVLRDSYNSLYGDALQNFYP